MIDPRSRRPAPSLRRIAAFASVRMHRVIRTRLAILALILALLPWALVDSPTLITRLSALTAFTLVGLTVIGAGAIGDDLDSGEYAIALTHDSSPLDLLAGQAAASLVLVTLLVALQLPIALAGATVPHLLPLLLCIVWLAALLAGWLALMLLLATFLEGKGNAIAMIGVLFVPLVADSGLLDRLPHFPATVVRNTLQLLPQANHATAVFRVLLSRSPASAFAPVVLIVSPFLYFALASYRLHRVEPAGRLAQ
jgi:hypothetical protein